MGLSLRSSTNFDQLDKKLLAFVAAAADHSGRFAAGEKRSCLVRGNAKLSKVPILFLSSHNENLDIIMALNQGGDDYLTKPFSMEILVARIQALLRRAYSYGLRVR